MNTDATDEMIKKGLIKVEENSSKAKANPKNLYNCHQCGNAIITEDIDEGVTPKVEPTKGVSGATKFHKKFRKSKRNGNK